MRWNACVNGRRLPLTHIRPNVQLNDLNGRSSDVFRLHYQSSDVRVRSGMEIH